MTSLPPSLSLSLTHTHTHSNMTAPSYHSLEHFFFIWVERELIDGLLHLWWLLGKNQQKQQFRKVRVLNQGIAKFDTKLSQIQQRSLGCRWVYGLDYSAYLFPIFDRQSPFSTKPWSMRIGRTETLQRIGSMESLRINPLAVCWSLKFMQYSNETFNGRYMRCACALQLPSQRKVLWTSSLFADTPFLWL